MALTIGVEVEILAAPRPTGVERALGLWLEELPRVGGVAVKAFARAVELPLPPGVPLVSAPSRLPLALWRETRLPRLLREEGVDVLFSPVTAFPLRSPVPVVATIHELPWLEKGGGPAPPRELGRALLALRRAARVLAVSAATARQCLALARWRRIPPGRLRVVRHGFQVQSAGQVGRPTAARDPLVVTLAAPRPRKNLPAHLRAFARAAREIPAARYYLVGPTGRARRRLASLARGLGLGERISLPGYLPDPEVAALLERAALLFHAPLSEGFGFPPLEALSRGCVPLLSRRGALPEINRDAALYVADPADPEGMGRTLAAALGDIGPRAAALEKAPARLARRDPQQSARRLARVCAEAAGAALAGCDFRQDPP